MTRSVLPDTEVPSSDQPVEHQPQEPSSEAMLELLDTPPLSQRRVVGILPITDTSSNEWEDDGGRDSTAATTEMSTKESSVWVDVVRRHFHFCLSDWEKLSFSLHSPTREGPERLQNLPEAAVVQTVGFAGPHKVGKKCFLRSVGCELSRAEKGFTGVQYVKVAPRGARNFYGVAYSGLDAFRFSPFSLQLSSHIAAVLVMDARSLEGSGGGDEDTLTSPPSSTTTEMNGSCSAHDGLREAEGYLTEVLAKLPHTKLVLLATHTDKLKSSMYGNDGAVEATLRRMKNHFKEFLCTTFGFSDTQTDVYSTYHSQTGVTHPPPILKCMGTSLSNTVVDLRPYGSLKKAVKSESLKLFPDMPFHFEVPSGWSSRGDAQPKVFESACRKLMTWVESQKKLNPFAVMMPVEPMIRAAEAILFPALTSDAGCVELEGGAAAPHSPLRDKAIMAAFSFLHDAGTIFLFSRHRLLPDNGYVISKPEWFRGVVSSLFVYRSVIQLPRHQQNTLGVAFSIFEAERRDQLMFRQGYLRWPLAEVLFESCCSLQSEDDDGRKDDKFLSSPRGKVGFCLSLLMAAGLIYPVSVGTAPDAAYREEEPPFTRQGPSEVIRYYVPALAPRRCQVSLRILASLMFHWGRPYRFHFNVLPWSMWFRLQSALSSHTHFISWRPVCDGTAAERDVELLCDGRLVAERNDLHNRWRDAMWLAGEEEVGGVTHTRRAFLLFDESQRMVSLYTSSVGVSSAFFHVVNVAIQALLAEYPGVVMEVPRYACPCCSDQWLQMKGADIGNTETTDDEVTKCAECGWNATEVYIPRNKTRRGTTTQRGDASSGCPSPDPSWEVVQEEVKTLFCSGAVMGRDIGAICINLGLPFDYPAQGGEGGGGHPSMILEPDRSQYEATLDIAVQVSLWVDYNSNDPGL